MGHRASRGALELEDDPSRATGYTPFFMVYSSEAILPTNLDYGAPRVRAMMNRGPRHLLWIPWTSWIKHATLPSSARPSTSKRYAGTMAVECGVRPSTSGTWCSPHLEQQELPQALSTMGGTVCHREGAPTGHLQAQDHRWQSLCQCLEH